MTSRVPLLDLLSPRRLPREKCVPSLPKLQTNVSRRIKSWLPIILLLISLWNCGLIAHAQEPSAIQPADSIYFNGRVVTVNADSEIAEAFAVRGDRIVLVGSNTLVKMLSGPNTNGTSRSNRFPCACSRRRCF
jgi:hypothetical protein